MTRPALAILSILAYLAAFLAPMLPTAAIGQTVTVIESQSHCKPHHSLTPIKVTGDHCQISCAAHAPALPSLSSTPPEPTAASTLPGPASQRQWQAAGPRPDPRPPRTGTA